MPGMSLRHSQPTVAAGMIRHAARAMDPWTSHDAADEITGSGKRQTLMEICLDHVGMFPGMTAGEIGEATGLGHERVWRRLSDLKNKGLIQQGPARKWHGKSQMTWHLVLKTKQLELI